MYDSLQHSGFVLRYPVPAREGILNVGIAAVARIKVKGRTRGRGSKSGSVSETFHGEVEKANGNIIIHLHCRCSGKQSVDKNAYTHGKEGRHIGNIRIYGASVVG
jgi:hypothetical protein